MAISEVTLIIDYHDNKYTSSMDINDPHFVVNDRVKSQPMSTELPLSAKTVETAVETTHYHTCHMM